MDEYTLEFLFQSENAILVKDGNNEIWLPKSKIVFDDEYEELEKGELIKISIPNWIAEDKELC
jgi:hypothetical protein